MVSGSLALLYFLLGFHGGMQGSGPDRGQSPVEWGDFLSICLSVCPPLWAIHPGWLGLRPGWMAQRGDVQTNGQTNVRKICPFYRTLSLIGAAAQKPTFCWRCSQAIPQICAEKLRENCFPVKNGKKLRENCEKNCGKIVFRGKMAASQ